MNTRSTIKALCLSACLAAAPLAVLADESASPSAGGSTMGHSAASKEHMMMNQNRNTGSSAPEAPSSPDNGMGHSQASKDHMMMNQHKHHHKAHTSAPKPDQQ